MPSFGKKGGNSEQTDGLGVGKRKKQQPRAHASVERNVCVSDDEAPTALTC